MIYFIQNEISKAIKIGFSDSPIRRLVSLQTATPDPLVLLATTDGGFKEEQILHQRFEDFRLAGEWFSHENPNDSIPEFVAGILIVKKAIQPYSNLKLEFPELSFLVSAAVQHPVSTCSFCGLYQVMRWDDGPGPGDEFWSWHQSKPQLFESVESACVAYVASYREWMATQ
jgi:hypothetical protein